MATRCVINLSDSRKSHYKDIFMPIIKTLQSQRELNKDYNSIVVAIIENNTIIEPPNY